MSSIEDIDLDSVMKFLGDKQYLLDIYYKLCVIILTYVYITEIHKDIYSVYRDVICGKRCLDCLSSDV